MCWHSKLRNAGKTEEPPSKLTPLSSLATHEFPKSSLHAQRKPGLAAVYGVPRCEIDLGAVADIGAFQLERVMNCAGC